MAIAKLELDFQDGTTPRALGFRFDVTKDKPATIKKLFQYLTNAGYDTIAIVNQDREGFEIYKGAKL